MGTRREKGREGRRGGRIDHEGNRASGRRNIVKGKEWLCFHGQYVFTFPIWSSK